MMAVLELIGVVSLLVIGGFFYLRFMQEIRSMKDEGEL
jgi:hypothetical protein